MNMSRWWVPGLLILALAACSSAPKKPGGSASAPGAGTPVASKGSRTVDCPEGSPYAAATEDPSTRGNYTAGGLYKPGVKDTTPTYVPNVACIPEPLVVDVARSPVGNKSPYTVLGKQYQVMDRTKGYSERGTASYYGAKFHGRLTSNREVYDMYTFSAAHKTLPLPSFALVTNLDNGESVVVRVNDRGPFHDGRVIDLSYAAAVKLGITQRGTGNVEVRALTTADNAMLAKRGARAPAAPASAPARAVAAAPVAAPRATPAPAQPQPQSSSMDRLVGTLPAKTPTVSGAPAKPAGEQQWRYNVADQARPGSADNFERWMQDNNVRVATGRPAAPAPATSGVVERSGMGAASASVPAAPAPTAANTSAPSASASSPSAPTTGSHEGRFGRDVLLQVASFASQENATRALGQLSAAGIAGATLSDIVSGGRTLWRLRVAASDTATASELAGRIAGLGFGRPQIVKD